MNVPPHPLEAQLDERILAGFEATRDNNPASPLISTTSRLAAASMSSTSRREWLRRACCAHARADRLVIFPGAQTILFNLVAHLARPGDVVLTEELTFPGIKAVAARLGVGLVGVAMDDGGILPDALAKACREHRPKAVYLIPTLHNPTTATLSAERRQAIAKIIRDADTHADRGRRLRAAGSKGRADRKPDPGADAISPPRCQNASRRRCAWPIS